MGLQMRNGPQTWPLASHDGEISPRQYTALVRRASSLHYRPKHFLSDHNSHALNNKNHGHHDQSTNVTRENTHKNRQGLKKHNTNKLEASTKEESWSEKQALHRRVNKGTRMALSLDSVHFGGSENPSDVSFVRNGGVTKSLKSTVSPGYVKQSSKENGRSHYNSDFYVRLSNGTHLSESNDFDASRRLVRNYKCALKQNRIETGLGRSNSRFSLKSSGSGRRYFSFKNLRKSDLSHSKVYLVDKSSPSNSVIGYLVPLSLVSSSTHSQAFLFPSSPKYYSAEKLSSSGSSSTVVPSSLQSPSSLGSPTSPTSSFSPFYPASSFSPYSSPQFSPSSPSSPSYPSVLTQEAPVKERPYYDCGYDTDYDSTPPHSSSECATGKLKSSDSPSVWRRYLSWLHRMVKTQG